VEGLAAIGYRVIDEPLEIPRPDDVLVSWNRHGMRNVHAARYEKHGAPVIITENGWLAAPKSKTYALLMKQHNCGTWPSEKADRTDVLGAVIKPWRAAGDDILLLAQRGIGSPEVRMPGDWVKNTMMQVRAVTSRPIRVRYHPGQNKTPLEPDLVNVHAVVTWASGAAIKALAHGIPAFYCLPNWVGADAAKFGVGEIERPFLGDRMPMFRKLAWAQFTAAEIAAGWPLARLLNS
jgi:hypothetical protein